MRAAHPSLSPRFLVKVGWHPGLASALEERERGRERGKGIEGERESEGGI